ncbi:hypothetical protein EWS82_13090, partial [Staphylococcus xylosus]|nr:hypothetical protein [Staphylococcus xylosus]
MGFESQIAAFLILEFGVIFHSVIIGLNLGYVERKYKLAHVEVEGTITSDPTVPHTHQGHQGLHSADQDGAIPPFNQKPEEHSHASSDKFASSDNLDVEELKHLDGESKESVMGFESQIAAFLILEFGVIFHSVIIGLNLG